MPRNMSFAMTTEQYKKQTKTVTRRFGWWFLKEGDICNGVNKVMGFKKGEKMVKYGKHKIISTRKEPLNAITKEDVVREGFPDWTPAQFVNMLVEHYGVKPSDEVNRIEFEYINN